MEDAITILGEPLLSRADVAKFFKVSPPTITKLHLDGKLPCLWVNTRMRFPLSAVKDYIARNSE